MDKEKRIQEFYKEIDIATKLSVFKLSIESEFEYVKGTYKKEVVYRTKGGLKNAIRNLIDPKYEVKVKRKIKLFIYLKPDKIIT